MKLSLDVTLTSQMIEPITACSSALGQHWLLGMHFAQPQRPCAEKGSHCSQLSGNSGSLYLVFPFLHPFLSFFLFLYFLLDTDFCASIWLQSCYMSEDDGIDLLIFLPLPPSPGITDVCFTIPDLRCLVIFKGVCAMGSFTLVPEDCRTDPAS